MLDTNSHYGVYHYRKQKKRTIATLLAKFDNVGDARKLLETWQGVGLVYVAPCDERAEVTPAGKKRLTEHHKNAAKFKSAPDKSWEYVGPIWNKPSA